MIEQEDTQNIERLKDTFRYQDDLIVFNEFSLLHNVLEYIYPKEMIINNTNISARKCCYLVLVFIKGILECHHMIKTDYNFKVISYPFLNGNVPNNLSYGLFISQLVRDRINSTLNGFKNCVTELLGKSAIKLAALRNKFVKF